VGGILPKDIEDGSFTTRIRTSNDKLLEQLIGRKRANAHLAAKRDTARPNGKAPHKSDRFSKKEESDDDEESRAAVMSKRSKTDRPKPVQKDDSDDEDEESRAKRLQTSSIAEIKDVPTEGEPVKEEESPRTQKSVPRRSKARPKSFLDELLAERSKKKQNKARKPMDD
jgi:hypothetical protein